MILAPATTDPGRQVSARTDSQLIRKSKPVQPKRNLHQQTEITKNCRQTVGQTTSRRRTQYSNPKLRFGWRGTYLGVPETPPGGPVRFPFALASRSLSLAAVLPLNTARLCHHHASLHLNVAQNSTPHSSTTAHKPTITAPTPSPVRRAGLGLRFRSIRTVRPLANSLGKPHTLTPASQPITLGSPLSPSSLGECAPFRRPGWLWL